VDWRRTMANPRNQDTFDCRLQEVRSWAPSVPAAPMPQVIALAARAALRISGEPVHEPVHGRGAYIPLLYSAASPPTRTTRPARRADRPLHSAPVRISLSTRRPPSSSLPSRPRSKPVRLSGHDAHARVLGADCELLF